MIIDAKARTTDDDGEPDGPDSSPPAEDILANRARRRQQTCARDMIVRELREQERLFAAQGNEVAEANADVYRHATERVEALDFDED